MGTEQRTEGRTGGSTSTVQSTGRFYLVGAPGVGKSKIAEQVAERFDERLSFYEDFESRYALGSVADYRVELSLAMARWKREQTYAPTLFKHSLLDNLAYTTYAVSRFKLGTVSHGTVEREVLVMAAVGAMITDSFKYDHIFFVRGDFDPNEDYDQYQMQTILQMLLDEYQLNYSIIDASADAADEIGDIIERYLD